MATLESRAASANPYVVRFGPWARNLYLGLPAAFVFGLISVVAEMPLYLAVAWNLVVAVVVVICAFPRETRFHADGTVVVLFRFLALLPVWRRKYPRSALKGIRLDDGSFSFADSAEVSASTVWLVLQAGSPVPIQSYSDGADNQPPVTELVRELRRITGLPVL